MQDWEREKLQKAIISRSKSLADLKHHWNQHAPINRLPPELLEKVFILTRNETLALFSTAAELASDDQRVANVTAEFYREQPYLWTSVALVCRHCSALFQTMDGHICHHTSLRLRDARTLPETPTASFHALLSIPQSATQSLLGNLPRHRAGSLRQTQNLRRRAAQVCSGVIYSAARCL